MLHPPEGGDFSASDAYPIDGDPIGDEDTAAAHGDSATVVDHSR